MIEQSLNELFQQMAARDLPPNPVDVPQVIRQGRSRRQWRRFRVALAPALAAAAVLAIALTTTVLPAHNPAGSHSQAPANPRPSQAVDLFSVMSPYAWFGWLPAGTGTGTARAQYGGSMLPAAEVLDFGSWELTTFAPGVCYLATAELHCGKSSAYASNSCGTRLQVRAPAINGDLSYWVSWNQTPSSAVKYDQCLAWQYRPGGWAVIDADSYPTVITKQGVVRAARSVTFSDRRPLLKFPAQLAGMPGRWHVKSAGLGLMKGTRVGTGYNITNGSITVNVVTTVPAVGSGQCESEADHCYLINGYHVNENIDDPDAILVDRNADGLQVSLWGPKDQLRLLRSIFAHLKLLGPNPSAWTTTPIS